MVSSCRSCNSPSTKGEVDTIEFPPNRRSYTDNRFKMVHPYFDDPSDHFKFQDERHMLYDWERCSVQGRFTINMFHWNDPWAIEQRDLLYRSRDIPGNILRKINDIVLYK